MHKFPNLNAIRAFECAARFESFAKAAEEMAVTQAAVSRHVRNLENELGVSLFQRGHRSITLTREGRDYADRVAEGLAIIAGRGGDLTGGKPSRVTIEVDSDLMANWIVPRLHRAVQEMPDIDLDFRSRLEWPRQLSGDIDLALVWGGLEVPGFKSSPFLKSHAFFVAAPDLVNGPVASMHPSEFTKYRLIHERGEEWWRKMLLLANVPPTGFGPGVYVNRTYLAVQAAMKGVGLAIGDDIAFAEALRAGELLRLPGPIEPGSRLYFLLEPSRRRLSQAAKRVRDWLIVEARQHSDWQERFLSKA